MSKKNDNSINIQKKKEIIKDIRSCNSLNAISVQRKAKQKKYTTTTNYNYMDTSFS